MNLSQRLLRIYRLLYERYGPQGWWPADSKLECIIGAILTQNTSWKNVEKAIENLKREGLLTLEALSRASLEKISALIKPSGYYNQKAIKIKNFINFLVEAYNGDLEVMLGEETWSLREKLLALKGIGPETADSILLYAAGKPIFVVDAYTVRILGRHGIIDKESSYHGVQETLMGALPVDLQLFGEFHALLVRLAKEHCKRREAICRGCPLEGDPHEV
jgi:endonuclease-3 related protein